MLQVTMREEYPRPNFVREHWQCLNGSWQFGFDDENVGVAQAWFHDSSSLNLQINVPYAYQTPASGINKQEHHPIVWYAREFEVPEHWLADELLLHFGAVDYEATVWVNGLFAGQHRGGNVPFHCEISGLVQQGTNRVTVRVVDEPSIEQPRGKQSARQESWACWYTPVTGIWQSVWLEPVASVRLNNVFIVPDIDEEHVRVEYNLSKLADNTSIEAVVSYDGEHVAALDVPVPYRFTRWSDITPITAGNLTLPISAPHLWTPEHPHLYDLTIRVAVDDRVVDEIQTYFGMRKVHTENGQFFLNNRRYYQRMILDQGYWQEGLYTPPSAEAIRQDVELTKAMGFNGSRKHQKIEDPYFYYYCDKLGLLVWSEMPAAYEYTEGGVQAITSEWQTAVLRDRNHPSIVAWVPINESWGVDQLTHRKHARAEAHINAMYYATHALDGTRPVIGNDGWQHAKTDMVTIHEYTQSPDDLQRKLRAFLRNPRTTTFSHGRETLLDGYDVGDAPIVVTEFGGTKVAAQGEAGWGYGDSASDYDEMARRVGEMVNVIRAESAIEGFCYTQLTDVQQEVNGLLTIDREPKLPLDVLRSIFGRNK